MLSAVLLDEAFKGYRYSLVGQLQPQYHLLQRVNIDFVLTAHHRVLDGAVRLTEGQNFLHQRVEHQLRQQYHLGGQAKLCFDTPHINILRVELKSLHFKLVSDGILKLYSFGCLIQIFLR